MIAIGENDMSIGTNGNGDGTIHRKGKRSRRRPPITKSVGRKRAAKKGGKKRGGKKK